MKFEELGMEIKKSKAFVSDGASVMTGAKGGFATNLREEFSKSMIHIHCICHRLALATADKGDDYKFIRSFEQNLIELWKSFKNSPKRLKIYIRVALKSKEFDTMSNNRQKKIAKKVKKACRTRWLSLHAGVDAAFEEYEGIVNTLKEIQSDRASGSLATGLLKKINDYEFLGTPLYLLKHMLPNLSALSKTFQARSLNYSRIIPSINKCKTKIKEVAKSGKVWNELQNELNGRLKSLNVTLKDFEETRIKSLVDKYATSICQNIEARFPANSCKVLTAFSIFDVDLLPSQSSPTFSGYGEEEASCLGKHLFPEESADSLLANWQAFKFEMIEMKKKLSTFRKQIQANKMNFKKTSTEWTLEHLLNSYKKKLISQWLSNYQS